MYLLIKELFLKYNFNKHAKEFNVTCTASFKKAGKKANRNKKILNIIFDFIKNV